MLKAELGESVSLTVLESVDVVYLVRFPAYRVMTLSMEVGSRRPAYCTAMGRALLGELPEAEARRILDASDLQAHTPRTIIDKQALMEEFRKARQLGYATIDQVFAPGMTAMAAPVQRRNYPAIGVISIAGPAVRLDEKRMKNLGPALLAAAFELAAASNASPLFNRGR